MSEGIEGLTAREKETLRLLLGGHDIKSIAANLGLSVHTVNERLREARKKLRASSSRQAARMLGVIEQDQPKLSGDEKSGVAVEPLLDEHSLRTPSSGRPLAWLAGGMLVMSLIIAAAVAMALQGGGASSAQPPSGMVAIAPSASQSAAPAREWLALVDAQQWAKSWNTAGGEFRSHISPQGWEAKVQPVRAPLGAVLSRALTSVIKATVLPGVPAGQYEVLQFATNFANKPNSVETVSLAHEPEGWRVVGYFIK